MSSGSNVATRCGFDPGRFRKEEDSERDVIAREAVVERLNRRGVPVTWVGEPPAAFSGLAVDSRAVVPGQLFCAIRGISVDGHDFVGRAAAAGAAAALVERPVSGVSLPLGMVGNTRAAAAHLASLAHGDPGDSLRLASVTGTNGKTTTVLLLRHLLTELGPTAALGTLGAIEPDGTRRPGRLTTPGPVELTCALDGLREAGAALVAMEVSSHSLTQQRVAALQFEVAVFTNLTREHLDYHADVREYRAAKLRLAEHVESEGTCVVNADDPAWKGEAFAGRRVLRYGLAPGADVRADDVALSPAGSHWQLSVAGERWAASLPLLGGFNVANALAAAAAALAMGVPPARIAGRLRDAPQVPGRMEVLSHEGALILRDYAHTPDAFERVLGTLRSMARGRLIVVFGCGGDRDRGKRPLMGSIAAEKADLIVLTTDNPRSEDPARIVQEISCDMPRESYRVVLDRAEAISFAISDAGPGDVVLLAGKGHETYQEVDGSRYPFDEAGIVRELVGSGRR